MELFSNAKTVRLRSHHDKYLTAEEDEESVCQDRSGSSRRARWDVEFVEGGGSMVRLKSCYGRYLTASNVPFLLGMTGRKVLQTNPRRLDSSVEWEPVREGFQVRLKTHYGQFLRGNGGLPPWRNSVTHDTPHRTSTQDWVLWDVDLVEILVHSPAGSNRPPSSLASPRAQSATASEATSPRSSPTSPSLSRKESSSSFSSSPPKPDGRTIYYHITDDAGNVDEDFVSPAFNFKGTSVSELTSKLEEEAGLSDIIVCSRNPLNGKLYPLRLQLPPNNVMMHVVLVRSSSKVAKGFTRP